MENLGDFKDYIEDQETIDILEKSIKQYVDTYIINKNLNENSFDPCYNEKKINILYNLKHKNPKQLAIINSKNIQEIKKIPLFMPWELNPDAYKQELEKQRIRKFKEQHMAVSTEYKCSKCGHNETRISLVQTRSADEGATLYCVCVHCGKTWKYS